jgi:hypothetical protein
MMTAAGLRCTAGHLHVTRQQEAGSRHHLHHRHGLTNDFDDFYKNNYEVEKRKVVF